MTGRGRGASHAAVLDAASTTAPMPTDAALLKLLASPHLAQSAGSTEQYHTLILGKYGPGTRGDAAVLRLGDGPKGLALTTDWTERYCAADRAKGENRRSPKPGAT